MNTPFPNFQLFVPSNSKDDLDLPLPDGNRPLLVLSNEQLETHEELLTKMVSAINLDFKTQVHFLYLTENQVLGLARYCREAEITTVLFFGLEPKNASLHINYKNYLPMEIGGLKLLFSHSLQAVSENRDNKVKLWNALKMLFPQ